MKEWCVCSLSKGLLSYGSEISARYVIAYGMRQVAIVQSEVDFEPRWLGYAVCSRQYGVGGAWQI